MHDRVHLYRRIDERQWSNQQQPPPLALAFGVGNGAGGGVGAASTFGVKEEDGIRILSVKQEGSGYCRHLVHGSRKGVQGEVQ